MNVLKGYRIMMGETQQDWAKMLNIARETYNSKETKKVPFSDEEKTIIKNHVKKIKNNITIDELFF